MAEKILIADDDLETLRLVGMMLQRQGFQILAANNGKQAVSQALKEKPELIILDVMMPDMDGFEVTRQLRQDPETAVIPILMFTAKGQVDDKIAGFEAGADDYLTKPVHPVELVAHVRALLARRKTRNLEPVKHGYTVGVVAAKGGMGTSSLVLNLAITLHQKTKSEVAAAELRPGQGTWGLELGYNQPEGLNNLLKLKPEDITPAMVEKELVRTTYNIRLLMASNRARDVEAIKGKAQLEAVLNALPQLASIALFDIGTTYLPAFDKALALCQEVILIVEPQPESVRRTKFLLEELMERGFANSRFLTITLVNRMRTDMQLTAIQVQDMLGQPVSHVIPPAPEMAYQASIRSVPMVYIQPEGLVAQQYNRLAENIVQRIS